MPEDDYEDLKDADEEDIYSEEGREELIEDEDEITEVDEGFMKGYEEGAKMAVCSYCHKVLREDIVEEDFDDETYRFCSEECASKFEMKRLKKRK